MVSFAVLFSVSPSKLSWLTICHRSGEQPQAPPKSCGSPSPNPRGSNVILLSVWMCLFPLILFPQAATALPPRQAVLLCLHWPDGCRVVTCGFLGMAPGIERSQRRWRGAFFSVSGLLHKVGTASGFGTCHAWTYQAAEAGANRSNPRQAPSSLWLQS